MDTRIYSFEHGAQLGSVAFDYKGWVISVSTANGRYSEVLCWPADCPRGMDATVPSGGAEGVREAMDLIDHATHGAIL